MSPRVPTGQAAAAALSTLLLLVFIHICSFTYHYTRPNPITKRDPPDVFPVGAASDPPTNLTHLVFGIVGSSRLLEKRKPYLESWWRPNVTRGYLFLDKYPQNRSALCPATCPPVRINEGIKGWKVYRKIDPIRVRIVRSIVEAVRQQDHDVRWYVMGDDDSIFFVDNMVRVLSKYDHKKYIYVGSQGSEDVISNVAFAFNMGFGGAGIALSYPLAAALAKTLDGCIERYPHKWTSDFYTYICIADLGVELTPHKGLHQLDLLGDLSGFLSSHPQTPLLSLHHVDLIDPIFPNMTREEAIQHLFKPASLDQSRLLQQFICYRHDTNWSFSISWGYSVHVYESIIARADLRRPIETFRPWKPKAKFPHFAFNTREFTNKSCETPHVFFFDTIETDDSTGDTTSIVTTYKRARRRGLEACMAAGNYSVDGISEIRVISPANRCLEEEGRIECCDLAVADDNTVTVTLRRCVEDEEIV